MVNGFPSFLKLIFKRNDGAAVEKQAFNNAAAYLLLKRITEIDCNRIGDPIRCFFQNVFRQEFRGQIVGKGIFHPPVEKVFEKCIKRSPGS